MNRRYNSLLSFVFAFVMAIPHLCAQDPSVQIFGPNFLDLCESPCGEWGVESPFGQDHTFTWQILTGNSNPTGVNTLVYEVSGRGLFNIDWCAELPGNYFIRLTITSPNGGTTAVGVGTFPFTVSGGFTTAVLRTEGTHETACETSLLSTPPCHRVCAGSVSTLRIDNIQVLNFPVLFQVAPQGVWTVQNGQVVPPAPPPAPQLLNAATVYGMPGQTVCVPVTVSNFSNILGFQFVMGYDPAQVTYTGVQNLTSFLSGFGAGSVGNPSPGVLTATWNHPSSIGASIPNDSVLLEFCFQVTGNQSSPIFFTNAPFPAEVIDANENVVPFTFNNGAILVETLSNSISILWPQPGLAQVAFQYTGTEIYDLFPNPDCVTFNDTQTYCFDVVAPPPAAFTIQPAAGVNGVVEVCEGQPVYFTAQTTAAAFYQWDFGDGTGAAMRDAQHAYTAAGSYEVRLITGSDVCNCTDTSRVTIVVEGNEAPFVDCVATICEGTAVTYTATVGCSSYDWGVSANGTILDGGEADDDFVTIQWGAGPYGDITLATDGCPSLSTCTAAAYLRVPIISANAPISGATRVCRGSREVYSLPPFQGTAFTWSVSPYGTIVSGQGTPSITVQWSSLPIPAAAQWVRADYENLYLGCGGEAELPVVVRPGFFVRGEIAACAGATTTAAVISDQTNVGFPAFFAVTNAAGDTVWTSATAAATATINWAFGSGLFTVSAVPQNPDGFCTTSASFTVSVAAPPASPPSISGPTTICPGTAYTYAVVAPLPGQQYRWQVTDGTGVSTRMGTSVVVVWGAVPPYRLEVEQLAPPLFCASGAGVLDVSPIGDFAISGQPQACQDAVASYTQTLTPADVPFAWSVQPSSAGTIIGDATGAAVEVLWHTPGAATVLLDVCGQQQSLAITVGAPPAPIVPSASACAGAMAVVNTTVPFAGYSWQDTLGTVLATNAAAALPGGYYYLEVTDNIGCVGQAAFQVIELPPLSVGITTPDFNFFCNVPILTRLYAEATEDGYTYQWLSNGVPLPGQTASEYTATTPGEYRVSIEDANGCTALSNPIPVDADCNTGGGGGSGLPGAGGNVNCSGFPMAFTATSDGQCPERAYMAMLASGAVAAPTWYFDDPTSGAANTAVGSTAAHTYSRAGFYRVVLWAAYDTGAGDTITCFSMMPDTVYAVADFDYNGVCAGGAVQFNDLSTFLDLANITAWQWDFGDPASGAANASSDRNPMHSFGAAGDYTVRLTVTSAAGCSHSVSKVINIRPLPDVSFLAPVQNCEAAALPFRADVAATVREVVWDFGDPTSGDANTSPLFNSYHIFDAPGDYTVALTATDAFGCTHAFTRTVPVVANALTADITPLGTSRICAGDTLILTASATTVVDWNWSTGATSPSIEVHQTGVYGVTATDGQGCTFTPATAAVEVVAAPRSPIRAVAYNDFNQPTAYTYDTLFVCAGTDVFLETVQTAGHTYLWSNGSTLLNISFEESRGNQLPVGQHLVTLAITDAASGCSGVERFVVVVRPAPSVPLVADVGVACAGTMHTFSVSNPMAGVTYFWSNGSLGTSLTTSLAGQYYVRATNPFGCTTESAVREVLPGPDASLVPNGCHARCTPDTLRVPTIPDVATYQWYLDGAPIPAPDGNILNLIVTQSGRYTLGMTDTQGCAQTSAPLDIDLLPGYGTLAGEVYYDLNGNQIIDAADSLAAAIGVELYDVGGSLQTIATTQTGNYGFINLPEDAYSLQLQLASLPAGWTPLVARVDTSFVGCDQTVAINWLLVPDCVTAIDTMFSVGLCIGEVFRFRGVDYPIGTTTSVEVNTAMGCDTIYTFTVRALATSSEALDVAVCPGENYTYQGVDYPVGTNTAFTFVNRVGCDSIIRLQVAALPTSNEPLNVAVCPGESYTYQGVDYPIGTSTAFTFVNSAGCDSIIQLRVAALPTSSEPLNVIVCAGESYTYQGVDYPAGTNTAFTFVNSAGCDSIIQLQVSALPINTESLNVAVCPGENYTYQGVDYPIGTNTAIVLASSAGCDSIIQLQVAALPAIEVALSPVSSCPDSPTGRLDIAPLGGQPPFTYTLEGMVQPEPVFEDLAPGDYTLTVADAAGCTQTFAASIPALPALVVDLADAVLACGTDAVRLMPTVTSGDDGALQFAWPDGSAAAAFSAAVPGAYAVRVSNACQTVTKTARVTREFIGRKSLFYVPNAFSPNGDEINDAFRTYPDPEAQITAFSLQVFDRWGGIRFETDQWDTAWTADLEQPGQAVYVWVLRATVSYCGDTVEVFDYGDVVLVR